MLRRAIVAGGMAAVLAASVFVNIFATVGVKSQIINLLPLQAQTKLDAVRDLCRVAYARDADSSHCFRLNHDADAMDEVDRLARTQLRKENCAKLGTRIVNGDPLWKSITDKVYQYIGPDLDMQGYLFFTNAESCMLDLKTYQPPDPK
jgi:hypothetical protein